MNDLAFSCPRTCPLVNAPWCRFRPILDGIGPVQVNSHTVKVRVEYTDLASLERAVRALGWTWTGQGTHRLYEGSAAGCAFTPAGWNYPAVLGSDGNLAYDTYGGRWGDDAQLERLKAEYAACKAQTAAEALGWLCERTEAGLVVHHPDGGTMTVAGTSIDATGFQGTGCHDAIMALGLPWESAQAKPEYGSTAAQVQLPE